MKINLLKVPKWDLRQPGYGILFTPSCEGYNHHLVIGFYDREIHLQFGSGDSYDIPAYDEQ